METAFAWLGDIVRWIGQWIPRWEIVNTTQGAVKWIRGSKVKALGPGFHIYWPLTTEFLTHPTARQAVDLRSQTLVTKDDKTIVAGGLIVYDIKDIEKLLAYTYMPDQTIRDIGLSAIHDVLCCMTWDEIKAGVQSGALDRELRKEMKKQTDDYGVRIYRTTLTDLAPCKVLKLIQSTSQDGI